MLTRQDGFSGKPTRPGILPGWICLTLPLFALVLFLYSLPGHQLNDDEAWLGEQAYYRAVEGVARSPMFRGIADAEKRVVVQHKLLVESGALAVWLGGWGLWPLRLVAVFFALMLFLTFARYGERRGPPGMGWLAAGVLLLTPLYFQWGKIYRPEILVAAFAFSSFVLLESSYEKKSLLGGLIAGILAGAAAYSHYNGVTVIAAGAVTLIVLRRFRGASLFLLGAVLALAPYAYEIAIHRDLFYRQIFENPLVSGKAAGGWTAWFLSLVHEHKRLFRSPEILVLTVPFLVSLGVLDREHLKKNKVWYIFWFMLMFFTALVVKSKLARYALVLHPFFAGEILRAIGRLPGFTHGSRQKKIGSSLLVILPACIVLSIVFDGLDTTKRSEAPATTSARWATVIPDGSTVVAPVALAFNQIDRYDIIAIDLVRFDLQGHFSGAVEPRDLFESCAEYGASYVIVPVGLPEYEAAASSSGANLYRPVYSGAKAVIFQRLAPNGA